jgi:hypothetical protein
VAGSVALGVTASAGLLYFNNLYGPLGERPSYTGRLAGLGCGVVAGAAVFAVTRWVARRSRVVLIALGIVICVSAWVLMPHRIDVSESWVPQPNPRWACTGWSFQHYPPGTMDGNAVTYCVGLEERIADG